MIFLLIFGLILASFWEAKCFQNRIKNQLNLECFLKGFLNRRCCQKGSPNDPKSAPAWSTGRSPPYCGANPTRRVLEIPSLSRTFGFPCLFWSCFQGLPCPLLASQNEALKPSKIIEKSLKNYKAFWIDFQ